MPEHEISCPITNYIVSEQEVHARTRIFRARAQHFLARVEMSNFDPLVHHSKGPTLSSVLKCVCLGTIWPGIDQRVLVLQSQVREFQMSISHQSHIGK